MGLPGQSIIYNYTQKFRVMDLFYRETIQTKSEKIVEKSEKIAKLLKKTRIFASRAVNLAKLSHISATIWRPLCAAPPGVAGAPGAPLRHWDSAGNPAEI